MLLARGRAYATLRHAIADVTLRPLQRLNLISVGVIFGVWLLVIASRRRHKRKSARIKQFASTVHRERVKQMVSTTRVEKGLLRAFPEFPRCETQNAGRDESRDSAFWMKLAVYVVLVLP